VRPLRLLRIRPSAQQFLSDREGLNTPAISDTRRRCSAARSVGGVSRWWGLLGVVLTGVLLVEMSAEETRRISALWVEAVPLFGSEVPANLAYAHNAGTSVLNVQLAGFYVGPFFRELIETRVSRLPSSSHRSPV
jgi:hypothetical protein